MDKILGDIDTLKACWMTGSTDTKAGTESLGWSR